MDRRDLEKISHVVLRRIGLKWEWLRLLPGGGNAVDPSTDWQWTANEWEKHTFPNQKEAEQYAGLYGGLAIPCKLPDPEPTPPPPPTIHHRRIPSKSRELKPQPDRKLFGYGIND
jgi:hypothetical protein